MGHSIPRIVRGRGGADQPEKHQTGEYCDLNRAFHWSRNPSPSDDHLVIVNSTLLSFSPTSQMNRAPLCSKSACWRPDSNAVFKHICTSSRRISGGTLVRTEPERP